MAGVFPQAIDAESPCHSPYRVMAAAAKSAKSASAARVADGSTIAITPRLYWLRISACATSYWEFASLYTGISRMSVATSVGLPDFKCLLPLLSREAPSAGTAAAAAETHDDENLTVSALTSSDRAVLLLIRPVEPTGPRPAATEIASPPRAFPRTCPSASLTRRSAWGLPIARGEPMSAAQRCTGAEARLRRTTWPVPNGALRMQPRSTTRKP